jgi:hypothetical protein
VFEMGNCWGKAKGDGEEGGRDQSGRESHHDAKEGFQVSKKGIQSRGQGARGLSKGLGYALRIMLILHISG